MVGIGWFQRQEPVERSLKLASKHRLGCGAVARVVNGSSESKCESSKPGMGKFGWHGGQVGRYASGNVTSFGWFG